MDYLKLRENLKKLSKDKRAFISNSTKKQSLVAMNILKNWNFTCMACDKPLTWRLTSEKQIIREAILVHDQEDDDCERIYNEGIAWATVMKLASQDADYKALDHKRSPDAWITPEEARDCAKWLGVTDNNYGYGVTSPSVIRTVNAMKFVIDTCDICEQFNDVSFVSTNNRKRRTPTLHQPEEEDSEEIEPTPELPRKRRRRN